jgi:RecA-family ATPase
MSFVPPSGAPTIAELAVEIWGEPNKAQSKPDDIRFGSNGGRSITPSKNVWHDFEQGQGGGYVDLWKLARGDEPLPSERPFKRDIKTTYPYWNADASVVLLEVVRTLSGNPRFWQRAPDGNGGWVSEVKHVPGYNRLLYRYPGLRHSGDAMVWIPEGEKDCDNLHDEGEIATCNIGGAGKWRSENNGEFRGKHVGILADNDPQARNKKTGELLWHPDGRPVLPGQDHAENVARNLHGIATSVKLIMLPGLPPKGDVSWWLENGGTIAELYRIAEATPEYAPGPDRASPGPDIPDREDDDSEPPTDRWDDRPREDGWPQGNGRDQHSLPVIAWEDRQLSRYADHLLHDVEWIIPAWIPRLQVTGIYGEGGALKTDWLLQSGLAKAAGLAFMGIELEPSPVYGLFCEDSFEELLRRLSRMAAQGYGRSLADFPNFHFASLLGVRYKEFVTFDASGRMLETPALLHFDQKLLEYRAGYAVLDTLPHFFGGNEVNRRDVTQFISMLDGISMARRCGIAFSAHPSATGARSGTFTSGSTGWEGGVRSRLSIHDPGMDKADPDDPRAPRVGSDRRVVTRWKSNHAPPGATLELVWQGPDNRFFLPAAVDPGAAAERGRDRHAAADEAFLTMLGKVAEDGRRVHDQGNNKGRYAPAIFAQHPANKTLTADGRGFSEPQYFRAMQRLFGQKRIRLVNLGPEKRPTMTIVVMPTVVSSGDDMP